MSSLRESGDNLHEEVFISSMILQMVHQASKPWNLLLIQLSQSATNHIYQLLADYFLRRNTCTPSQLYFLKLWHIDDSVLDLNQELPRADG